MMPLLLMLLLLAPAQACAQIFHDTFTDTDGVDLVSHTPDTGTSWTEIHDTGTQTMGISGNAVTGEIGSSTRGALYSADVTYPSGNYTVTVTYSNIGTGVNTDAAHIGCRYQNSGGFDGYMASIGQPDMTNDVRIYRIDNGTATKISASEDTSPADADVFVLECNGSSIGLKKNGSYVISPITDATYTTGAAFIGVGEVLGITEFGTVVNGHDATTFTVELVATGSGASRRRHF